MRFLILLIPLFILACGSAEEPEPTAVVLQTEGNPTSTPPPMIRCAGTLELVGGGLECRPNTPLPPPPPEIIYVVATPEPQRAVSEPHPVIAPTIITPEPTETPPPTPTVPTPTLLPTQTPVPTPVLPRYRPVGAPANVGLEGFKFTKGPTASSLDITFSARIESSRYRNATEIQVWQSLTKDSGECSTERPIAFITKPRGGDIYIPASTDYTWTYCTSIGQPLITYHQKIPWLAARSWSYSENSRLKTFDPYITNITVHIDLRDDRVDDLRYTSSAGYILLIFDGKTLLSRVWVEDF